MTSTSTTSTQKSFKYEVFLSFRGEDTRKNFVEHLYHALDQRGIMTYKDDIRIEKGEKINDQLIESIQDSRFHIIVFSKNYASSSWCLEELVKIMECQETNEHAAFPLFYDVEPTQVRNQSGLVGEAFARHVKKEAAGRWKDALEQASNLAGWELKNTGDGNEVQFIRKVVEEISRKLNFTNYSFYNKLVGMKTRVENLLSSIEVGANDVRMIGIKGMSGGGKTTLAKAVFDHISGMFEGKCFVENVREGSKRLGLEELQKHVLSVVLNEQSIVAHSIERKMRNKKVLLVLDDVDHMNQLEALAGELTWFKAGSRIMITTRDQQLLVAHGVQTDNIHDVNLLTEDEAICLFSRYAFQREVPNQGYEQLSREVLHYAAGLPLTIKVLGLELCSRTKHEWKDAIERLKAIPEKQTLERLELSYVGLDDDHKDIFLDVACILKGERKHKAIKVLRSCGYHAEFGLKVLEDKSLINISYNDELHLHDLIEEMGRNVVRRSYPDEPERHSRLWSQQEIDHILVNDLGTEAIRSIKLDSTLDATTIMQGLKKMTRLRFLHVSHHHMVSRVNEVEGWLPDSLRYLYWYRYPFRCLPKTFRANNLVNLHMHDSNISELWEGEENKVLNSLRFLKLRRSRLRTFDLETTPNLEVLDLESSVNFEELFMPSVCRKLRSLNLRSSGLRNLNIEGAPKLEKLILEDCKEFVKLNMSDKLPKLKILNLRECKLDKLNLVMAPNLEELHLEYCFKLEELCMPSVECPILRYINLSFSGLRNLNLQLAPNLKELYLESCYDFLELNMSSELPQLKILKINGSEMHDLNLMMVPHLEEIEIFMCEQLAELQMPYVFPKLRSLKLCLLGLKELNLRQAPSLEELYVENCSNITKLNISAELPQLKTLKVSGFGLHNLNLAMTPHLEELDLNCLSLTKLHMPVAQLKILKLRGFELHNLNLMMASHLQVLDLFFHRLAELHMPVECLKLKVLRLSGFKVSNIKPGLTPILEKSKSLEVLSLSFGDMKCLPDGICMLKNLKKLILSKCSLLDQLPEDLGRLECLEELDLRECTSLQDIPKSICKVKSLKKLDISDCFLLKKLPEEFGNLKSLKSLNIEGANIEQLPQSIFQLIGLEIKGHRWQLQLYFSSRPTSLSNDPCRDRSTAYYCIKESEDVWPTSFWY